MCLCLKGLNNDTDIEQEIELLFGRVVDKVFSFFVLDIIVRML